MGQTSKGRGERKSPAGRFTGLPANQDEKDESSYKSVFIRFFSLVTRTAPLSYHREAEGCLGEFGRDMWDMFVRFFDGFRELFWKVFSSLWEVKGALNVSFNKHMLKA